MSMIPVPSVVRTLMSASCSPAGRRRCAAASVVRAVAASAYVGVILSMTL
jgi:hypothetical protein